MPEQGKDAEKWGPPTREERTRVCSTEKAVLSVRPPWRSREAALCPYPGEAEEVAVLEYSRYRVLCVIAVGEGLFVKQE